MDREDIRFVATLTQSRNIETVAVPFVPGPAFSHNIRTRNICNPVRNELSINVELDAHAIPGRRVIHCPTSYCRLCSFTPAVKIRRKRL